MDAVTWNHKAGDQSAGLVVSGEREDMCALPESDGCGLVAGVHCDAASVQGRVRDSAHSLGAHGAAQLRHRRPAVDRVLHRGATAVACKAGQGLKLLADAYPGL